VHPVIVLIFHAPASPDAGPLAHAFTATRIALAAVHRAGFLAAGAADVRIIAEAADRTFGERLRSAAAALPAHAGAVILGSGSLPLASAADRRRLVAVAAGDAGAALANNRYSGDVVALPDARRVLAAVPDLPGDNALPRWLAERAGLHVTDLRGRWQLQADLDGLADLVLLARSRHCPPGLRALATADDARLEPFRATLAAVEAVGEDRRAELVVTGRLSADGLAHLERATACRVRALVEERGLRAASWLAQGPRATEPAASGLGGAADRPPASVLGLLLDAGGPGALGAVLTRLGDGAIVDTRVLLAHGRGADERAWPRLEDRLASDLLLPDRIADPWLRALTESALAAPIPVLLGGHSLVGPGLRLLFPTVRHGRNRGAGRVPDAGSAR
jgi:hypothetical protein